MSGLWGCDLGIHISSDRLFLGNWGLLDLNSLLDRGLFLR
jgi:hypothetical protein